MRKRYTLPPGYLESCPGKRVRSTAAKAQGVEQVFEACWEYNSKAPTKLPL